MDTNLSNGMHHANVLVGDRKWALSCIEPENAVEGPDVIHYVYERMSIADVRALIQDALRKPVERSYRVFLVMTDSILGEAQNALLKLFEEPNVHTMFYLIIPREDMLLPTLRSRLHVLGVEPREVRTEVFTDFQKRSYNERLTLIGEKLKKEDFEWITQIVRGAESFLQTSRDKEKAKDIFLLVKYINTPGCSKKMLLEHLALSL